MLKPAYIRMAANRAQDSGYSFPVIFGHQKCRPAKKADTDAADHDVVEMRDHEIGVGDVHVDRDRGEEQARQPAGREQSDEAERIEHRRFEADLAAVERRRPVEHLDRRRHRDDEGQKGKDQVGIRRLAGHEHVVAPDEEADPGDRDHRIDHEVVAEDAPAREAGNDLRDDAHRRQDHDVDRRVASRTRTGAGTGSDRRHWRDRRSAARASAPR